MVGIADFYGMCLGYWWRWFLVSRYVLLSLLFVFGLELVFALQQWVWVVAGVVLGLVFGIVLVKTEEGGRFRLVHVVLPLLAAVGLSAFAVFLPTTPLVHLYAAGAGLLFFFALTHGARRAYPVWNWAISLVVYFLNIAVIFGFYFHLYIPTLVVLCVVFAVTAAMAFQGLSRVSPTAQALVLPTLGIALGLTEVGWVLQFLPAHYLVGAGVLTTLYYIVFNLITISYNRALRRTDVLEYLGLGTVAMVVIVATARWI